MGEMAGDGARGDRVRGRDVEEAELAAKKCNDCGFDLSAPKQSVSVWATSVPKGGTKLWGE